jgi:hypothetical protein
MRTHLRRLADPILIQATLAAAISFAHIHDIAEAAGQGGWKAWAYPVSVDLLMVMAWKRLRTPGAPKRGAWVWFVASLAASLSANVATAGVLDMEHLPVQLRVIVAGWPALAFLGGALLLHSSTEADKEPTAPEWVREELARRAQEAAEEPAGESGTQVPAEPVKEPEKPVLVTYAEAAAALNVAPETVRGAANSKPPRLIKYEGPKVDLRQARTVLNNRRPVGV